LSPNEVLKSYPWWFKTKSTTITIAPCGALEILGSFSFRGFSKLQSRLCCPVGKVQHCGGAVSLFRSNPDNYALCRFIDVPHHSNLLRLLAHIHLINAYGICPQDPWLVGLAQGAQCRFKIHGRFKGGAIQVDSHGPGGIAPSIG
jgi:hypothetical protein